MPCQGPPYAARDLELPLVVAGLVPVSWGAGWSWPGKDKDCEELQAVLLRARTRPLLLWTYNTQTDKFISQL